MKEKEITYFIYCLEKGYFTIPLLRTKKAKHFAKNDAFNI